MESNGKVCAALKWRKKLDSCKSRRGSTFPNVHSWRFQWHPFSCTCRTPVQGKCLLHEAAVTSVVRTPHPQELWCRQQGLAPQRIRGYFYNEMRYINLRFIYLLSFCWWDQQYVVLQVAVCAGISIIVDAMRPCTYFPRLAHALAFKEFAIYQFYTGSIRKRLYNFAHVYGMKISWTYTRQMSWQSQCHAWASGQTLLQQGQHRRQQKHLVWHQTYLSNSWDGHSLCQEEVVLGLILTIEVLLHPPCHHRFHVFLLFFGL